MKILAIVLFLLINLSVQAQIKNGLYKSDDTSFQSNFFLLIAGEQVTLFGWELNEEQDTVFYRSTTGFDKQGQLTFHQFDFSRQPIHEMNVGQFQPEKEVRLEFMLLHRRLFQIKAVEGEITLLAVKDIYDSRADKFSFKRIKN